MFYIDTDTATQDHKFTDGDESQGVVATDLNAAWFNMVQEELQNVVTNGGGRLENGNNSQLWNTLSKFGIRGLVTASSTVSVSSFTGSVALVRSATSFSFSGTFNTNALIIVIPTWSEISPASISVTYGHTTVSINKYCFYIGLASNEYINGSDVGLDLRGINVPISYSGSIIANGGIFTSKMTANKVIDPNIVTFNYNNENEGLQDWQTWQLMENWELHQVKKVFCSNAAQEGTSVRMYYDNNGQYRSVKFYPTSWREVMCVGQHTVSSVDGDIVFAVLLVNGKE